MGACGHTGRWVGGVAGRTLGWVEPGSRRAQRSKAEQRSTGQGSAARRGNTHHLGAPLEDEDALSCGLWRLAALRWEGSPVAAQHLQVQAVPEGEHAQFQDSMEQLRACHRCRCVWQHRGGQQ